MMAFGCNYKQLVGLLVHMLCSHASTIVWLYFYAYCNCVISLSSYDNNCEQFYLAISILGL